MSRQESSAPKSGEFFLSLEILRGLCALEVVLWHCFARIDDSYLRYSRTFEYGSLLETTYIALLRGSDLAIIGFFVISGFVITESFSSYFKRFSAAGAVGVFYSARLLRIWALSIPSVLVSVALAWHYRSSTGDWSSWGRYDDFDFFYITKSALGLSGHWNAPMWTLAYEICFYFLLPLTLLPILAESRKLRYAAIVMGAAALVVIVRSVPNVYMFVPFVVGMALYFLLPAFAKGISSRSARIALFLIGSASVIFFSVTGDPENSFAMAKVFAISLMILSLLLTETFFRRNAGGFTLLLALSAASYSLYLWHWPVLWFTAVYSFGFMNARTTDEIVTLYSIALPTLVLVTFLSWYLIERNARMKNVLRFFATNRSSVRRKREVLE